MTEPTSVSVPAGWYPTGVVGEVRYWDGSQWTEHIQSAPQPGAPAHPIATETSPESASAPSSTKKRGVKWWVWALVGLGVLLTLIIVIGTINAAGDGSAAPKAPSGQSQDDEDEETVADEEPAAEEPVAEEQEPAIADPEELVLGETAFGIDAESGMGWYAIEVTNPNDHYVFTSMAAIEVEAYDAAGVLLDTDTSYGTILQGRSMYVGDFFDIGAGVIDRIEVRGPTAENATYSPKVETGTFTLGEITTGSEYDWMTVNGTVTSNFAEDQDMVRIDLVARDAAGTIVGVDFTYTDRVPAGGTAAWNTQFWEVPLDSKVEAYPHP
jgi:hypothetical protein